MNIIKIDRTQLAPPEDPAAPEQPALPAATPEQAVTAAPLLEVGAFAETRPSLPSAALQPSRSEKATLPSGLARKRPGRRMLLFGLLLLVAGLVYWDVVRLNRWKRPLPPPVLSLTDASTVFDVTCFKLKEYFRVNGRFPASLGSDDPAWTYTLRPDGALQLSFRAAGRVFRFDSDAPGGASPGQTQMKK